MSELDQFETDIIPTSSGDLTITFLGHGSLLMVFKGLVICIDPFGKVADFTSLPKADIILVTHDHFDHMDLQALSDIRTDETQLVMTEICARQVSGGMVLHNGDIQTVMGIPVTAVPAYNVIHKRPNGDPFHPKGSGNGYILDFNGVCVYIAGDTENIPEMKNLTGIDIAFLPMNLPYTMTPEMVADAAKTFRPHILYPYHYGETEVKKLVDLLKGEKDIEVRIRKMS